MPDSPDSSRDQYGSSGGANPQSPFQQHSQQQAFYQQQAAQGFPPVQSNMSSSQGVGIPSSLNMASLSVALPDVNYVQGFPQPSPQRFQTGPGSHAYQLQQVPQYPGQSASNPPSSPYNFQHPQQFQGMYAPNQVGHPQSAQFGMVNQQFYLNQVFQQQRLQGQQQQQVPPFFYQQGPQFPGQVQMFVGSPFQPQYGNHMSVQETIKQPGQQQQQPQQQSNEHLAAGPGSGIGRTGSTGSSTNASPPIRGPPRKPKQSGHALWVGNLPPAANVVDLKDHFARHATDVILSVFLISKSNCAFVNYKTEEACAAAMARFHESRFQGVGLVCRLRRSSANVVPGVPTGPAALTAAQTPSAKALALAAVVELPAEDGEDASKEKSATPDGTQAKEKFFIVKSLTVEDLEMSARNGIWATQSHNEEALNKAYKTADTVYLIFSANKSGEYFGYARMTSPINQDPAAAIAFAPQAHALEAPDQPRAIATPATASAPRGRIIDDSARGTIFWEAETDDLVDGADDNDEQADHSGGDSDDAPGDHPTSSKAWGKPFTLAWESTARLPFYRTRGLRNPWNANREVKIARDGTELETGVGRRLVRMFQPRAASPGGAQGPPVMGGGGAGGFLSARRP